MTGTSNLIAVVKQLMLFAISSIFPITDEMIPTSREDKLVKKYSNLIAREEDMILHEKFIQ